MKEVKKEILEETEINCVKMKDKLKAKVELELLEHELLKSEIKTEINEHYNASSDLQNERAELIAENEYLKEKVVNKIGRLEQEFNDYIEKDMKIAKSKHFAGDALVGNLEDRFHKEVLSDNYGFLDCLKDSPAIRRKNLEDFVAK